MHLRKRAMILLILQVNSLQIYQQHLKVASASNAEFSFRQLQQLILTDAKDNLVTATPAAEYLDVQRETQRQLQLEMQSLRNDGLLQAPAEPQEHPLHAQRWFQLQQQLHLMLHEQIILLYDNEQNFHVLQKSIRLQQQQCQEGSHWQSSALTELPQELTEWLRELLQELSVAPAEDELKSLANDFESQAKTRSKNKDEYLEIYTAKISQIQGWIASLKIQWKCAQLLPQSSSPLDAQQDIHNPPPSPTFSHLIPRFIDSYRPATANPSSSEIPWDKDEEDDEQLLIQFLGRLPNGSLRVFSSNKFSFRSRALLELLTSGATQLQGLACLSMYRNDAFEVNTQLMATDWYEEESLAVDPFTAEMDRFLHRCPLQLHTLRIAIAGSLEPMHRRLFEQRSRAARYKTPTPLKATSTAMKHLYLEGDLAMGGQAGFLERCPDLRSLGLSCTKQYPLFLLAPMIVHCPKIEDLAISCPSRSGDDMTNSLSAVIRGCAPTSTSTSSSVSLTSSTTAVIQRKGLKRLRLENLQASQDAVIEALLLCAPTLTHLAIRDCQTPMTFEQQTATETFESTISFNRVLETFTQLQELDLMRTPKFTLPKPTRAPRHVMLHGKFDAQHLVELKPLARSNGDINKAWACSSTLKVLRIEINGIHRAPPSRVKVPDAHKALATTNSSSLGPASLPTTAAAAAAAQEGLEGPDPEQIKEGYRLQREVCLLLGTLSSLEELCLGTLNVPGDDSPPALPGLSQWKGGSYSMAAGIQTQCLELALSTGLELMSEMKEMRVLKVGGLEHRIGLGEIQWMCEHWPKLEAVYGLLRVKNREQYDPDWEGKEEDKEMENEVVEWIRKNRPHLRYT
ncbi:hypothetical protein BGZ72_007874 [Mortierella alpina]|nr:hypothetical protein BGZ72_007874 [Mortierella alpina]